MIFKYIMTIFRFRSITNALKGQNHQRRTMPCDWRIGTFQALKMGCKKFEIFFSKYVQKMFRQERNIGRNVSVIASNVTSGT